METLFSIFAQHHTRNPEKIFFYSKYGNISYELADSIIQKFADSICHRNLAQAGPAIAVSHTDPDVLFFVIWACIKTNISLILLPPLKDPVYVDDILKKTRSAYLISNIPGLEPISQNTEFDSLIRESIENKCECMSHPQTNTDDDAAFIFHTSGTTGIPKLVKIEYSKFSAALSCLFANNMMPYTIDQTAYLVPPLFHSYGLSSMLEYTNGGSAIKLPSGINFLDSVKELTRKDAEISITAIEGVPYFYHYLSLLLPKLKLNALKHIGFGGDAIQPEVIQKLKDKFPGVSFSVRYGLTETPSVVSLQLICPPYSDIENGGTILPIYDVRMQVSESSPDDFTIAIKGPCIGSYLDNTDIQGDWFETGDNGYIKNGRLFITGRESAFIKNRGYRVSPAMIESVILNHKGIKDCVVYSHNGELTANIVVDGHETLIRETLLDALNAKLPEYYVPGKIIVCNEIPRTITGKIVRRAMI